MARKIVRGGQNAAKTMRSKTLEKKALSLTGAVMRNPSNDRQCKNSPDNAPSLGDRIQAEREQLFKAISLVECCKYASATLLDVEAPDYIVGVYDLLCDLLDSSAGELGSIADDCRGTSIR